MLKRFSTGSLSLCFTVSVLLLSGCGGGSGSSSDGSGLSIGLTKAHLGKKIFFDTSLSSRKNQSCATCHDPDNGFADARVSRAEPVSEGSKAGAFGDRNAPTAAYASFSPVFGDFPVGEQVAGATPSLYRGGQFLDGRRSTLVEQAKDPFENTVEMNMPRVAVVTAVRDGNYADDFLSIYPGAFDEFNNSNDPEEAYSDIADAIAAFETSTELNPFTAKYDYYLRGQATLTDAERRGLELFKDSAKCANCHTLDDSNGALPSDSLFTNFGYYNVGTPSNGFATTPVLSATDEGLGSGDNTSVALADLTGQRGKFKVPTLRNIALTAPYMHNGVHETLEEVIRHYDTFGGEGIDAEVGGYNNSAGNIADELLDPISLQGLGLDSEPLNPPTKTYNDYTDLEAFMRTLTDGYIP